MSLSVERLKELVLMLEEDLKHHDAHFFGSIQFGHQRRGKIADELAAIRELIAIKEAEPVAYASRHSKGERFILHYGDMSLWENQPLIRKPE